MYLAQGHNAVTPVRLEKTLARPPSSDTNYICRSITGSKLQVMAEHARIKKRDRGPLPEKSPISIGFYGNYHLDPLETVGPLPP